jgi:ADP-ribose pyrophosphatase YjhB (NUDIX family)
MLSQTTLMTRCLSTQMAKDAKAAVAILYHLKTDTIARVNHKAKGYEGRKMYKARAANIYYEPGGKLTPGETAQDAVIREVHEETGLDLTTTDKFTFIGSVYERSCKAMVFCYTVAGEEPPSMTPGDGILACHWTPRRFAKQGAHYRLQRSLALTYDMIARAQSTHSGDVQSTRNGGGTTAAASRPRDDVDPRTLFHGLPPLKKAKADSSKDDNRPTKQ